MLVLLAAVSSPAAAAPILFVATLNGANESPPNASSGTGFASITLDPVAHTLKVDVVFQDLDGLTTVAHIHVINGPGDANLVDTLGPVATTTPSFSGFPVGATAGSFVATFDTTLESSYRAGWIVDSGGSTALAESALFAGIESGRAYLNIHSTDYPGGEIRGFLAPGAVPEPSGAALFGIGVLAVMARTGRLTRQRVR
jgi:hypothetical protein